MSDSQRPVVDITIDRLGALVNSGNIDNEIIVFDQDLNLKPERGMPSRMEFLLIAICTRGSGRIGVDMREFELLPNTLIVIQPRNFVSVSGFSEDFKCSAIAFSKAVVDELLPKFTDILPLLMQHRAEPVTHLPAADAEWLRSFYVVLHKEINRPASKFRRSKIMCLIQAALYELLDINLRNTPQLTESRTRKKEIMARFLLQVSEDFREERSVAYYAQKLCITPKHLSSVVKGISGKTAGEWIDNYVVMEARVMLKNTDLTIQEVADALHFANQSFFGKYFRSHTGMSPTAYRKLY